MCTFSFPSAALRSSRALIHLCWNYIRHGADWIHTVSSPFSYTCKKLPKDAENQLEAALGAVSALRQLYGTSFNVRPTFVRYIYILMSHSLYRQEVCVRHFISAFRSFLVPVLFSCICSTEDRVAERMETSLIGCTNERALNIPMLLTCGIQAR